MKATGIHDNNDAATTSVVIFAVVITSTADNMYPQDVSGIRFGTMVGIGTTRGVCSMLSAGI